MATSLVPPSLTESALTAAPAPRPPQPIKATLIVLLCPAYIRGAIPAAKAEAAAIRPVSFKNSRRDVLFLLISFIVGLLLMTGL